MLMSFLGAVGFIMDGSGLKELFSLIYAETSAEKALTGHAFSGSVRDHILVHLALSTIIFSSLDLSEHEEATLSSLLQQVEEDNFHDLIKQGTFQLIKTKFISHFNALKENGPTAELWVQYFNMITIVKTFIEAERCGNWKLHLNSS